MCVVCNDCSQTMNSIMLQQNISNEKDSIAGLAE